MKHAILIVEDEEEIVRLIVNRIDSERFDIFIARDGKEALQLIGDHVFDIAIIDLMIPKIDGFRVCEELRRHNKESLIVIVSALGTEENRIRGYGIGADDFISKPFSPRELAVKINALLKRRYEIVNADIMRFKNISHDPAAKKIRIDGVVLTLTPSEYLILATLLAKPKNVISKETLAQAIYDSGLGEIDARGIDTHIYNLRKKIGVLTSAPIIRTERSMGYKIYEF